MDEKTVNLHKKTHAEYVKSHPKIFNPNFNKHMKAIVGRDEGLARKAQQERRITTGSR